jgi:hypothetical protein
MLSISVKAWMLQLYNFAVGRTFLVGSDIGYFAGNGIFEENHGDEL